MGKITFTPKILLSTLAAQLAALAPSAYYDSRNAGMLLRPTGDLPCVISARNGGTNNAGLTATAYSAMISKLPVFTFAPDKPLLGPCELTYLQALGTAVGAAASLFATANAAYTEPVWTISDELFDRYTLKLGRSANLTSCVTANASTAVTCASTEGLVVGQVAAAANIPAGTTVASITDATHFVLSAAATGTNATITVTPLTIITDKDGITFTPEAELEWIKPAMEPTRDARLASCKASIEFRPHNMDVDEFYAQYFPEVAQTLGGSYEQYGGCPVSVTGTRTGSAVLTIPWATRAKGGHDFSTKNPRTDKVTLELVDWQSGGAWLPLFTLSVVA